jgi:quinol monooxygenase YgiN
MAELQGVVRFRFHPGKVEDFKRLSERAMEIVRARDPGTLQYETYFNEDESEAMALERFRDAQSLIVHGQNMAELMDDILACGEVTGELLGELTPELQALMTGDNPRLFPLKFMAL